MGGTFFVPFCIFLFFSSIGKLLTVFSKNLTVTSPNCFPSTSKWTPLLRIQCINLLKRQCCYLVLQTTSRKANTPKLKVVFLGEFVKQEIEHACIGLHVWVQGPLGLAEKG